MGQGKKLHARKHWKIRNTPDSPLPLPCILLSPNPGLIFLNRLQNSQNRFCKARYIVLSREAHRPGHVWPEKTYFSHLSPVYMYLSVFTVSPDLSLDHLRTLSQPRQKIMWQSRCFYSHQSFSEVKSKMGTTL